MVSNNIDSPAWDENELVLRLKKGQEAAYRILVRQYQEKLFGIAYGITLDREESRDIVQEVFLKVYSNIRAFKGDSKLYIWLRRITINHCWNRRRSWKRRFRWHHEPLEKEDSSDRIELETDTTNPERLYEKKELEKILHEGLKALPKDARTVFILKELEGLTYDDIASLLKIKKGTVSSRIFYARQSLKAYLSKRVGQE